MTSYAPLENIHAKKAASAARIVGIVMTVLGALVTAVGIAAFRGGDWLQLILLGIGVGFYLGPGLALLFLSKPVRNERRGPTIAVMVLGILFGAFMMLSLVGNLIGVSSRSSSNLFSLVLAGVLGLAAALMAAYCGRSLKHIREHGGAQRGFEAIVATPVMPPQRESPRS